MKILMVCTGNICRSPTAEGVMRAKLKQAGLDKQISVDSAGTHSYHIGNGPDKRAIKAAKKRGYDLTAQRARQIEPEDFDQFDLIIAMDAANLRALASVCPDQHKAKIKLLRDYQPNTQANSEVPDPYYGEGDGFELVLDMVEESVNGLIKSKKL